MSSGASSDFKEFAPAERATTPSVHIPAHFDPAGNPDGSEAQPPQMTTSGGKAAGTILPLISTRPDVQSHDQEYFQDQSAANGSAAASPEAVKEYGAFAATDDIVTAHNIHKTYLLGVEGVPALRGVSCKIKKGEFIVILGKSGGGKTSLLNIIGTIDKPTKGELAVCGYRITNKTTDAEFAMLRLRKIGFVFQTFNLISTMTALENVELPMILDGRLSSADRKQRATVLLEKVGMARRVDHLPSQLSGGEQQRVTIARALANSPEMLLLDEPTGDLDTHNRHIIMALLLELNRKNGITCVMVTHDSALASFAHRVIHMVDGKIFMIQQVSSAERAEAENDLHKLLKREKVGDEHDLPNQSEVRDPGAAYPFLRKSGRNDVYQNGVVGGSVAATTYTATVVRRT